MKRIAVILIFVLSMSTHTQAGISLPPNLELNTVFVSDVSSPLAVRHAGDGSGRLFIMHQGGVIKIWNGVQLLSTPFLDISSKITSGGEQGLLGMDFDPNYSNNGYFYVSYTKSGSDSGDTVIERYQVSGNADVADANSGVTLFRVEQLQGNHNGGDIHFGPDGYLYVGIGDGGPQGDPGNYAQNTAELLGKMLRVNVNPDIIFTNSLENDNRCGLDTSNYYIPSDNPFAQDAMACGEIWAYGFRNPWRWSFDKNTGDLLIGDVGQDAIEEVSFQPSTSTGGENYGWRCREGNQDYNTSLCNMGDSYVEPVITETHAAGNCSVTGGYMYRGPIAEIQGMYIYSDWCKGDVTFADPVGLVWPKQVWGNAGGFCVTSFGEDELGNIYLICNNTISRFELGPPP